MNLGSKLVYIITILSKLRIHALFSTTRSDFWWPIQTFFGPIYHKKSEFGPSPANSDHNWQHCLLNFKYFRWKENQPFIKRQMEYIEPPVEDLERVLMGVQVPNPIQKLTPEKKSPALLEEDWKPQLRKSPMFTLPQLVVLSIQDMLQIP